MSYEMLHHNYPSTESLALDPSVFWLDPRSIAEVNELINHTHLSTMSLGVETLTDEQRNASHRIAKVLIDPRGSQAANLQRAIEVGYLYGRLISRKSLDRNHQYDELMEASGGLTHSDNFVELLQDTTADIDVHSQHGAYKLFAAVRSIELTLAHSDILAFSLGASQEHMKQQFNLHDKTTGSLDSMNMIRMQSLYYTGALAAALETSGHGIRSKPLTEVTRSMILSKNSVTLRLNFDGDDDLLKSLDHEMSHKLGYSFSLDNAEVTPSGFQIGPNKMTLPEYTAGERQSLTERFQAADIAAIFVEEITGDGLDRLIGITDYSSFVGNWLADTPKAGVRPVGILVRGLGCIASYNGTHPNAAQLRQLAGTITGEAPDQVAYSSTAITKNANLGKPDMPLQLISPGLPDLAS